MALQKRGTRMRAGAARRERGDLEIWVRGVGARGSSSSTLKLP